jgi:hypothetical protein
LSSEYFFYQLDNFFHTTKNIEKKIGIKIDIVFVVYIRPEFEFVESIYNQSIKRNGNYNSFPRWSILPGKEINRLKNIIASIGPEFFSLRAYGSRNFYKTNIIEDFLSEVDLNFKIEKDYIVNNSYSFESLEFKRWVNKYSGTLFDNELDVVLQSIEWGDKNYSLLPNSLYQSYKTQSLYNIKELNEVCEIHDFNRLSKYIDDSERKPYKHQVLGDKGLKLILDYVYVKDKTLLISIIDYIDKIEESNGDIIKIKIKIFLDGKKRVEVK